MLPESHTSLTRILLLESILRWEGRLNNGRLRELVGLSAVRASEWIRELRERHPNWTAWDTKTRSFHATPEVYRGIRNKESQLTEDAVSFAQYLALVGTPHTASDAQVHPILWAAFPDLSVPRPNIFSGLSEAIRVSRAVEITYRSIRDPKPHQRAISPHSLVRAGRRWHVRAYCSSNQGFRDFALGRIGRLKILHTTSEHLEADDDAWMTKVRVRLVAHPEMTPEQQALIRFEYFNDAAARVQTCRGCLVSYFIQDMRAATDTKMQRPPEYQLAVENINEVKAWLF